MKPIIVNVGEREFAAGLTYTACSRVRTIQDLTFEPFPNYLRFKQIFLTNLSKIEKLSRREN